MNQRTPRIQVTYASVASRMLVQAEGGVMVELRPLSLSGTRSGSGRR